MWRYWLSLLVLLAPATASAELVPHGSSEADPDGSARSCLSCHDGSKATRIFDCTAIAMCHVYDRHMLDVAYPPREEGKREGYASLEAVTAKGLRFERGKITCHTCHDLRAEKDYHLRRPYEELCKICHHRH